MQNDLQISLVGQRKVFHDFTMHSALASFKVSIDGNVASAAYNSQLAGSSILLTFCRINRICYRLGVCNTTVTVETSTGVYFTCAIKLRLSDKFSLTESD